MNEWLAFFDSAGPWTIWTQNFFSALSTHVWRRTSTHTHLSSCKKNISELPLNHHQWQALERFRVKSAITIWKQNTRTRTYLHTNTNPTKNNNKWNCEKKLVCANSLLRNVTIKCFQLTAIVIVTKISHSTLNFRSKIFAHFHMRNLLCVQRLKIEWKMGWWKWPTNNAPFLKSFCDFSFACKYFFGYCVWLNYNKFVVFLGKKSKQEKPTWNTDRFYERFKASTLHCLCKSDIESIKILLCVSMLKLYGFYLVYKKNVERKVNRNRLPGQFVWLTLK